LEHGFYDFLYIGNVIIPTDELDDFSEGFKPPTRKDGSSLGKSSGIYTDGYFAMAILNYQRVVTVD